MTIPSVPYLLFLLVICISIVFLSQYCRVIVLLFASWSFYTICQPGYIILLVLGTAVCYGCAIAYEKQWFHLKKFWIILGSVYFLGILFYYKYLDFFFDICNQIAGKGIYNGTKLIPIGISFYTFTALSYLFDVASEKTIAEKNYLYCALYLSFFPAVLSGPINRANDLLPQIRNPRRITLQCFKKGLFRIAVGTVKKLVVANILGNFVDAVFQTPVTAARSVVLLAVAAYSFQIFFDFSGYTDIALGAAAILGFSLPENFRAPYLAKSVRDFWRCWHISLTSWFRDYLYIPLGGSHVNSWRLYLNILIVFALSGLWHGADWHFVIWGVLNGGFQVLDLLLNPAKERSRKKIGNDISIAVLSAAQIFITFVLISFTWIFFRAENTEEAVKILACIFGRNPGNEVALGIREFSDLRPLTLAGVCIVLFGIADYIKECRKTDLLIASVNKSLLYWLTLAALTLFVAVFGVYGSGYNAGAFIYFQF